MITGTTNTENTYRAKMIDSSSSIKEFSLNRKNYYKKYILSEKVEDEETKASTMGRIVETLLLEPQLFDDKFYLSACLTSPTGLMLAFVEALYKYTMDATNEEGRVDREFLDISRDAYNESGFKITFDAVIKKFAGSDAEIYYQEILNIRPKNLTVITARDVEMAEKIVENLKTNFVTKDIVNMVTTDKITVYNQLQIEGFCINEHPLKSMIDKVIVDHVNKTVQPYDLKCVWAVENFYREYYLYRRAYIQAYVYDSACIKHALDNYPDYDVLPIIFIVCDSSNYYNPLLYSLTEDDLKDAFEGFEYRNIQYPGISEIVENLKWAHENNIWNMDRSAHESNGIVKLKN